MKRLSAVALLVGALFLGGCSASSAPAGSGSVAASSGAPVLDASALDSALAVLGSKPGQDLKPVRLGKGLLPPTNRWFSGLVFGDATQPVFPYPLSFGTDAAGFGFGVPAVTTTAKTIMGGFRPSVKVSVPSASSWTVTAYDELSVTLTAQGGASGAVTIAEGSPFVTYSSDKGVTLGTNVAFAQSDGVWSATDASGTYGVVGDRAAISATSIVVQPGGHVTWFAVPQGGKAADLAKLADPVKSTSVSYTVGDHATTKLHYQTVGGGPTAFGALPHQQAGLQGSCSLGTYPTVLGTMKLCSGNDLTWTSPVYAANPALDLSNLTDAEKATLKASLASDVAAAKPYPADTYFGGKELYRDSQLYEIAKAIGATDAAASLKKKVTDQLVTWANPTGCTTAKAFCFFYDSTNAGIVGETPSFGSDQFNDHHFHYGYFLYAAGVMALDDPSLAGKIGPVMNLLAADIANQGSAKFPLRRNFDSYASHSWASGTAPFADGNNQESASEAVNAWSGLTLWARASGNKPLETEATWMHALEASASRAYWTNFDTSDPAYAGFAHQITPLVFGGKRDYATWFSAEPAAAMAILVLPLNPSSDHLKGDAARIDKNVAEATGSKGFNQTYGDYLLMYSALAGETQRAAALTAAQQFPAQQIDDGNTRTYMLAWLYSLKT